MATKLKNMRLTSVDLVRAGANQEADICLFKSADGAETAEQATEAEKNIFKRFLSFLRESPTEAPSEPTDPIEKDYTTFDQIAGNRENHEKLWQYTDALNCSFRSILEDQSLDKGAKAEMMKKSLRQFDTAMEDLIGKLSGAAAVAPPVIKSAPVYEEIEEIPVKKWNPWHGADGRFTSGPGGAAGGVSSRTISGGGISIHVKNGKEPKDGYMCAVYADRAEWIKGDDVKDPEKRTAAIKSFMEKNKDVLADPDNYLGTWFDTESGNISLDISRNFKDKDAAIKYASEHNEKAIWDVANMAEISTGGTGNNL